MVSDLEGFGKAREEKSSRRQDSRKPAAQRQTARSSAPRPARKVDLDSVPKGYDADVWDVALFFEQVAADRGFSLAAGRPVLYAKLEQRITQSDIRHVTRWRDSKPLRWVPMVKVMIIDFWDDEVWLPDVAYAIDQFCDPDMFAGLRSRILRQVEVKHALQFARTEERGPRAPTEPEPEEEFPVLPVRTKPPRTWEERRAAVQRIREARESRRAS
jgi:hypothetical protein